MVANTIIQGLSRTLTLATIFAPDQYRQTLLHTGGLDVAEHINNGSRTGARQKIPRWN
jgi:hypothetical protein